MTASVVEIASLRIGTDMPIPQLRCSSDEPDVIVTAAAPTRVPDGPPDGELLANWLDDDGTTFSALSRTDDGFVFRIPNFFDVQVDAQVRSAVVTPSDDDAARLVPVLISGTVAALLLTLSGRHPLHASAVEFDGRCVAFVGDSGSGKSTLTALCCRAGARLVADDVLVTAPHQGAMLAHPGSTEIRLRPKAAHLAGESARRTVDDRVAYRPPTAEGPLPLAAIVEPWPDRETDSVQATVLGIAEATELISLQHRIGGWCAPAEVRHRFDEAFGLASAVPVIQLDVPWGPPFAHDLVDQIRVALAASAGVELGDIGGLGQR